MLIEVLSPAPVLNTPDFAFAFGGKSESEIPLNERGHPYCFEFVALKGMVFQVKESIKKIYRIDCSFYPKEKLFLDSRFTKRVSSSVPQRPLPPATLILERIVEAIGTPYVWGGNWRAGIPELLTFYPSKTSIDDRTAILWTMSGLDCSGLLFEATEGATPRNTSQLIHYGTSVARNTPLQPLDMLVYPGHVVFIRDEKTTIESKYPFGVIQRDLATRLWEFESTRQRVENWSLALDPLKFYTVRRFVKHLNS